MAFPILGTPKPQFFDSSGNPLVSGTLEVLDPADDTNKASYPTYDDAEASTNANSNPIPLDSRGEPTSGLWGQDREDYKLVLKDSTGATVYTIDDINLPSEDITYDTTATETALGIAPTNKTLEAPDPRRYGASTGSATNATAFQNAINVAATDRLKLEIPPGRWRIESTIYTYYDATNNPNYPSGSNEDGRLIIEGAGAPNKTDFTNSIYRGTIIEYTGSTGTGVDFYDSSGTEARGLVVRDIGIYGATTGSLVSAKYLPQQSIFENIFIGNDADGIVLDIEDIWASSFRDIWLYGNGSGTGLKYNAVEAGGGNNLWQNINSENVAIAFDVGAAYDAGRTQFIKNHKFQLCQAKDCTVGWRLRAGVGSIELDTCWAEGISGATGRVVQMSDMAGWMDGSYANPGLIRITGGNLSWTDTTAGLVGIEVGDDTGTETTDGVGNVIIDSPVFNQVGANTDAIRIHNSTNAGYREIRNPVFHNNGGQLIVIDDEAQYGNLIVVNVEPDGLTQPNWIEDTSGADMSHWAARLEGLVPVLTNGTYDYSNANRIPTMFGNTTGGAITINLPTDPDEFECTIYQADSNATDITIDPQSLNLNGATTDLVFGSNYGAVKLAYDTGRGFVAAGIPKAVAQAAHITDPTGGATIDAESRTAINAILVVLENLELTASS